MGLNELFQLSLSMGIVFFVFLALYSKFRNQGVKESWDEIRGIFQKKKEDVQTSLGEVRRRW